MKKGWKIFWIISGIAAGAGIVLLCIAFALGVSKSDFENSSLWHWEGAGRPMGDTSDEYTNIRELNAELSVGRLEVRPYDGDNVRVETKNLDERLRFQCYQDDDGELVIEAKGSRIFRLGGVSEGTICVYLPKHTILDEVSLSVGAGELYADGIEARSLDVKIGAGTGLVSEYSADQVEAECGTGNLEISGTFKSEADIQCGIGEVDFTASGNREDYNYELKCGVGEIEIAGQTYSGLGNRKHIQNGSTKEMDVKCGIGNVNIAFN